MVSPCGGRIEISRHVLAKKERYISQGRAKFNRAEGAL